MSPERAALRHDVAKYLTRVARNLGPGPIPPLLGDMLVRDLFEAPGGGRPERRFAELEACIDADAAASVRALFCELAAIEDAVRAHDPSAQRRGAELALEIERRIHRATSEELQP